MARCVISTISDMVNYRRGLSHSPVTPACVVHAAYLPCMHDGEPACPLPLHAGVAAGRDEVIRAWEVRTKRQRPLVIHSGSLADGSHATGAGGTTCWCGPEVLPAEEISDESERAVPDGPGGGEGAVNE